MNSKWLACAAAFLLSVSLAGCIDADGDGLSRQELREQHYKNHNLILHPPVYEWNNTNKEFSGYVILTNRFPDPTDEDKWIRMDWMNIRTKYWNENGGVKKGDGGLASWPLNYDRFQRYFTIKPGESMIFNFSFPPYNNHRDESVSSPVERIEFVVDYDYFYINKTHIRERENPNGYFTHSIFYRNDCLYIVDGEIKQIVGSEIECNPWIIDENPPMKFKMAIEDLRAFPPPELWLEWSDDSPISLKHQPWFRDDVEFLKNFSLEDANVVYFEGEIL